MATIYKRGRYYQVQFTEHGKLVQRSLGVTTKHLAEIKLGEILKNLELGIVGLGKRSVTKERAFQLFQREVLDKKSPPWRKRMGQQMMHFSKWLDETAKSSFAELKIADLEEYLATRRLSISDKTWNDELSALKVFYRWAEDREFVMKSPAEKVKRIKVDPKAIRVFTRDELAVIMKNATDHQRPFYQLLLCTGMREGELRNLEWADVDFANRQIFVRIKRDWQPKTRRGRVIPMAGEAYDILQTLPHRGKHVFSTSTGRRWVPPRQPWCDLLDRIQKKEGVNLHGQVSLHTFRHTFATFCLMSGVDIKTVSEFLGHTSVKMTEKYLHLLPEHKAREMEKVSFGNLLAVGHAA